MTKICEWTDVQCPYCGSEDIEDVETVQIAERGVLYMKAHRINCLSCMEDFYVPCDD